MSDLISRSELLKIIEKYKFGAISNDTEREYIKDTILNFVKEQPTAYDTDKVLEELDDYLFDKYCVEGDNRIFEIVDPGDKNSHQDCDCDNCANNTEPDEIDNGCYFCCKEYEDNYEPNDIYTIS